MLSSEVQNKNIAARFQFIEHAGKEILFLDFSHADRETCFDLSAEFDRYVQSRKADGNLRVLFDLESSYYDPAHINQWRARASNYEKYFTATAMIHVSFLFKILLTSMRIYVKIINGMTNKRHFRIFEDKTSALDFLSED